MALINSIISLFSSKRLSQIDYFKANPVQTQEETLQNLLQTAKDTEYGKKYDFASIWTTEQYRERLPIIHYEEIAPYSERLMNGEQNLLWPEPITWFAKSSGTTAAKSKFIPVSKEALENCHFRGGKDVISLFNRNYPDAQAFGGKTLALGGSSEVSSINSNCQYGDLSAILISNTPFWANLMKTPDQSIMLMSEWEEKIEKICDVTIKEDVRCLAGVPSWFLTLINRILERTGKNNLHEVWPNLELFIHGGVSFSPYREQYKRLLPNPKMKYMETYNASEGFFGIQDDPGDSSMLLMLDYGIYYEFMPTSELGKANPRTLSLKEVETNVNYALIISTNGGLWRYMIGDTIQFTSLKPYKFRITGRTKLFINAFGEELIIDNATQAMDEACRQMQCNIIDFTAAPVFMEEGKKGAHEWIVEFETPPNDPEAFAEILDNELKKLNSDYEAKRYKDMSLRRLIIHVARPNLFNDWLKEKGKLGGQNKVPRLWNDRSHLEELLRLNNKK
ncbi:GH3 auxin-responsive promoter family protein [uncultured Sanguibacteroides sp.]|uniref:GH3 auxin-responsive promoter family protein n=1 Tax=uncultured Sanguibacteroides sp. TaxID=1635151 RepID=UPI0025E914B8|nr:GH3 auxin-responsive promoter family protein [uncultured Sanguibacteroides sp.]